MVKCYRFFNARDKYLFTVKCNYEYAIHLSRAYLLRHHSPKKLQSISICIGVEESREIVATITLGSITRYW